MADQISLGKNGKTGKIDFSRIKAGVKKEELVKNNENLGSVFDMVDKNKDGILDRGELDDLQEKIVKSAGEDNNLEKKEVKNFDGQKLKRKDRKALLELLNNLDGVTPEDIVKVETKLIDDEKVEVVTFKDEHTEEYYPNGQKISEFISDNKKTKRTEMNGTVTSEVVTENEGKEDEIVSTTLNTNGQKQTIINNKGDKTTTTINYNGDKKSDATIVGENSTTIITYDSDGNPETEVETSGTTEKTHIYQNGQKVLQKSIENKGLEGKEITKIYDSEGGYTQTKDVANGKIKTVIDKNGNVTSNEKIEKINGQEVSLQLDENGNIPGVIVQNREKPADIAKKFGCSIDELIEINKEQLKGKGKNRYFAVGSEIKLPNSVGIEKFAKVSEGRKPAEVAKAEYARDVEIRRQKAEAERQRKAEIQRQQQQEREYYNKLGVKSFNNKSKKVQAEFRGGKKTNVEIIGQLGYGRQLVKLGNKLYTMSHDGKLLDESYLQAHKAFVNKPKNQRNNTASGIKNVTYVKDNQGRVWYFNEKTGKAIIKGGYTQIVKQESAFVANQLHTAAKGMGTDEELLEKGIKNIYSRDILQGVNAKLKTKDSDYAGDKQTMPVEALILDEMSHTAARPLFRTLINSGTMKTQEKAHTVKREIEYEVYGGTGYTSTSDLNEIMQLCTDREVRLEIEAQFKKDYPSLAGKEDCGSYVRAYIATDGWNGQEVDQFDANWVKTGAYQEARYVYQTDSNGNVLFDENGLPIIIGINEGDQAHRNGVIERLVFNYQDKEALNKGLDAMNDNDSSFDQQFFYERAALQVSLDPEGKYKERFTDQDPRQRYLAGFHSDKSGNVDSGEVSASNTCLYKGIKPPRVQAEEVLYNAKNGDYSQTFDSMDTETYAAIAGIIANGDINGVNNMTDLYNKAYNGATDPNDKTKIKANAILSGQLKDNFSDVQITDFCIELMHTIDANRGRGRSTGMSAGYTNDADYQTEQLKAILQNNPQVMAAVKARVEKGKFSYTTTTQTGGGAGQQPIVTNHTINTKNKYMQLLADTKTIANEEIFYDANGNKITDSKKIEKIKYANMQSLQQMRQYVAELERDFKKGVDAEGALSNVGNAVLKYSGLGTDREDVATKYRNAKLMLQQFEAAAQGKLRNNNGKVISAQDLAKQMMDKQNALAEANSDYKQSVAYTKMGIVLAPVIVVTTIGSGGAAAAGWGTFGVTATGGFAAGATTYGMNALEYNTSYTGNTAEAREQNLEESIVNGFTTGIGIGQGAKIANITKGMSKAAGISTEIGANLAADTGVGVIAEYATTGDISVQGTTANVIMSGLGNGIGATVGRMGHNASTPHPKEGVHVPQEAPITGRNEVADAQAARNIDQSHLNGRDREMIAKEMEAQGTPTQAELDAYAKEHAYQAPTAKEKAALDAHHAQNAKAYKEAHQIGNNAVSKKQKAPTTPLGTDETLIKNLENEVGALDGQINQLNKQLAGARRANQMGRKNSDTIKKLESQIETLQQKRNVKAVELETARKPAEVKADDVKATPEETPVAESPKVVEKPTENSNIVSSPYGNFRRVTTTEEADEVLKKMVIDKTIDIDDPKKGMIFIDRGNEYWRYSTHEIERNTKWKIHLYADSPEEWANVAQLALPYLTKNRACKFKTVSDFDHLAMLRSSKKYGDAQKGKAFTIYFKDEQAFLDAAKDLETIFDHSGLHSSGKVKNEAQIGESGFVSYRNSLEDRLSPNYKPEGMKDPYLEMKNTSKPNNPQVVKKAEKPVGVKRENPDITIKPATEQELSTPKQPVNNAGTNNQAEQVLNETNIISKNPKEVRSMLTDDFCTSSEVFDNYNIKFEKDNVEYFLVYDSNEKLVASFINTQDGQLPKYYVVKNNKLTEVNFDNYCKVTNKAFEEIENIKTSKIDSKLKKRPNLKDLIEEFNDKNIDHGMKINNGTIYYTVGDTKYDIIFNKKGEIICYAKRIGISDWDCYLYNSNGKAIKVSPEKYAKHTRVETSSAASKLYSFKSTKIDIETLLNNNGTDIPRFNGYTVEELNSLVQNTDDSMVLNALLTAKRRNSSGKYVYSCDDIINILKSDKAKAYILEKINSGSSFSRADLKILDKDLLFDPGSYKLETKRDLSHTIEDIQITGHNGGPVSESMLGYFFEQSSYLRQQIPSGEVANINGNLYVNDGGHLVKLKLSKEKFAELFPIEKRHEMYQRTLGDCWLVTSMGALMDSPKGRAAIYKMFSQEGNDIFVQFPGETRRIKFPNGKLNKLASLSIWLDGWKIKKGKGTDHVLGSKGIEMLEQAYSIHHNDGYMNDGDINIQDIFFMNKRIKNLDGGWEYDAVKAIVGKDHVNIKSVNNENEYLKLIDECIDNPNKIVTFSTKDKFNINFEYDLADNHAYHIVAFDREKGIISISNPWHNNEIRQIPARDWLNYVSNVSTMEII